LYARLPLYRINAVRKVYFVMLSLWLVAGCERHRPKVEVERGEAAVVFAPEGRIEFSRRGLQFLVELGRQMRRAAGVPEEDADRLGLAREAYYLLAAARRAELVPPEQKLEALHRVLAQVYLRRLVKALDGLPVGEDQLEQAHRLEIRRALGVEGSDIFVPETIDAVAAVAGFFPDLHVPARGEKPPFEKDKLRQLAEAISSQAAGIHTLDGFMALVRKFMADHPSLQLKEYWRLPVWPAPESICEQLHQALAALREDSAVSAPVETSFGVVVPFRVGGRPGRGKELEQVRPQLQQLVREQRRKELVEEHLRGLLVQYQAKKFYENIPVQPGD
jgi:hypothetical protein